MQKYLVGQATPRHAVRIWLALVAALSLTARPAGAQSLPTPGTVEVSGVTGISGNRQTVTRRDVDGAVESTGLNITTVNLGLETTYYISSAIGIGAVVSYQRFGTSVPDQDAVAKVAGGFYGPLVKARLPLGDKSTFVVVVSFGGAQTTVVNRNTGISIDPTLGVPDSDNLDVTALGRYWLAGGALSFALRRSASFEAGVRYQSSAFGSHGEAGDASAAGLLVGIGFSLYFGGR